VKSRRSLFWFAFVLPFVPSLAQADEPSIVEWTRARVQDGLVKPLSNLERSSFSRGRPEPHERRVRVLQMMPSRDKKDRAFVPYAIDVRYGNEWQQGDIVGCAYRASGNLYVKIGDEHRPAGFLLGKDAEPVPDACVATPPSS
jgi:hypothetical protein